MADRTKLTPEEEAQFQKWFDSYYGQGKIQKGDYEYYKKNNEGYDYDFRDAFKRGAVPEINPDDNLWHWPDYGKKLNHPSVDTYSKDSIYLNNGGSNMNPYGEINYDADVYSKLFQQPSNDEDDSYLKAGQADTDDIVSQIAKLINRKKKPSVGQPDTNMSGGMTEALLNELANGGYLA